VAEDSNHDIGTALVDFARGLSECESVEDVLQDLSDFCSRLLPVTGVGILLVEDGELEVGTTNSPEGEAVEALEVDLGQGPCVDCLRAGKAVVVPDLRETADRWPDFVPKALEIGIHSIHALPLTGRGELLGAMDIVSRDPLDLDAAELATAQMLADVAVSYILAMKLHEQSSQLASQLQRALDTRVVIEQAKGILSERHGEELTASFERLRRHARANNRSVRDVAGDLVEGGLRL
jgi:GAF domain-containing protein